MGIKKLSSEALVELSEVRLYAGEPNWQSDTDNDPKYIFIINGVSEDMINHSNMDSFKTNDWVEDISIESNSIYNIFPKNRPINSIASMYISNDWDFTNENNLIDPDSYKIIKNRYIYYKNGFVKGVGNVRLSYNAGTSLVPTGIQNHCVREVLRNVQTSKNIGITSRTRLNESFSMTLAALLPGTRKALAKYRVMRVAG